MLVHTRTQLDHLDHSPSAFAFSASLNIRTSFTLASSTTSVSLDRHFDDFSLKYTLQCDLESFLGRFNLLNSLALLAAHTSHSPSEEHVH